MHPAVALRPMAFAAGSRRLRSKTSPFRVRAIGRVSRGRAGSLAPQAQPSRWAVLRCEAIARPGVTGADSEEDTYDGELGALADELLADKEKMEVFSRLAATQLMGAFPDELMIICSGESRARFITILEKEVNEIDVSRRPPVPQGQTLGAKLTLVAVENPHKLGGRL